jgi:glycosyltransferase involved in cell wall biosynthesis
MKVYMAHPTGNQFFRQLSLIMAQQGHLAGAATCINWNSGGLKCLNAVIPRKLRDELKRRAYSHVGCVRLRTHAFREIMRLAAHRLALNWLTAHEKGWFCVDAVYQDFDRWLATNLQSWNTGCDAVYAYEDAAEAIFTLAGRTNRLRIYDLPIAYWETGRSLMKEEAMRLPAWAGTLGGGIRDSGKKLQRKTRELELADIVVTPSQFVADSLPDWARSKRIVISPFGSPEAGPPREAGTKAASDRPLRVLFAGSMGQRKGLGDLFAAMNLLDSSAVELVVMGSPLASMEFYRTQFPNFTFEAGRPHAKVLELMRSCDVFCLPSIVEGRALVMQEAMSQGLPLIITPNTGGQDLILEGKTGFLVPIRSPESIAARISWFLENRERLPQMSRWAVQHASGYTWNAYGKVILEAVEGVISRPNEPTPK